MDIEGHQ
jgi:hypothetical protein